MTTDRRVDWRSASLLGIDVGFSKTSKSTGIAIYDRGRLLPLACVGSSPQDRADALPVGISFDAIAIDGPIVTVASDPPTARVCEMILSRGAFSRRCKPGLSHFGFGLQLREAATRIAEEIKVRAKPMTCDTVEAFPNSFLGVLLDNDDYAALGPIKRGSKSDAYYARVATTGRFEIILANFGWDDAALLKTLHDYAAPRTRVAHDKRAALVCLLTAACALSGKAEYIGDAVGGYICLPPRALWADWAVRALEAQQATFGSE